MNKYTINGDLTAIHLQDGSIATINTEDIDIAKKHHWSAALKADSEHVYIQSCYKGSTIYLNRLIANARRGSKVVNIDGDTLNIRRSNLKSKTFNRLITKVCCGCGKEFKSRRPNKITCNQKCYSTYRIMSNINDNID